MTLLIDGYNLLYASGLLPNRIGPTSFQRARNALLDTLAGALDPEVCQHTTVVFDAKDAPRGLPKTLRHRGLTVMYAADHDEADDLIEELIRADSTPKKLTVVSSDHRLMRAAQRRRAQAVDSETWFTELLDRRDEQQPAGEVPDRKPTVPQSEAEVERWLREFGESSEPNSTPESQLPRSRSESVPDDLANPFPPGYGEDLLEDEDQ